MSVSNIADLYSQLQKGMLTASIEIVEATLRELTHQHENVTPFLISFYSAHVAPHSHPNLVKLGALTRKQVASSMQAFYACACELMKAERRSRELDLGSDAEVDGIIESLMINYGTKQFPALEIFESRMKPDLYVLLNVAYHRLKHKDEVGIRSILSFLLRHKHITLEDVQPYPEICHIKFGRNDVIWYLWQLLLLFTNRRPSEKLALINDYVASELAIFATLYQKKYRPQRLPILIEAYAFVCSGRVPLKQRATVELTRVCCSATEEKEDEDKDKDKHGTTEEESSVDYLMCFTIRDEDVSEQVKKDREKNRYEYKDL